MKEKEELDLSNEKHKMLAQEMANQADLIETTSGVGSDFCPGPFFRKILIERSRILKVNHWIKQGESEMKYSSCFKNLFRLNTNIIQ